MKRREFLCGGAALGAAAALPRGALADAPFTPRPQAWRKYEVTTRVEIIKPGAKMPANQLEARDLRALLDYLETLK